MDLFKEDKTGTGGGASRDLKPLADRMRPRTLDEFYGQDKIVGPGTPLRKAIESDGVGSLIFWGPPGSGKTTLAYLIAESTQGQFVPFSAATSGIKEVKAVISRAGNFFKTSGRRTYVFIDEIHRFNKAQQDAFLPYVESGEIILIGATTENPSFEVNSALLSRMRVYLLERLSESALVKITERAVSDATDGLAGMNLKVGPEALQFIAAAADGDARRALVLLENTAAFLGEKAEVTVDDLKQVHQRGAALYDKAAEEHYNLISALHKTIRDGDPDAALYWLARMLDGGEEPLYIVRRLIRFASEDVGLADPYALTVAINAREAYHFLGSPEGELAIAQAVIYLACAPKSNASYVAFGKAQTDAREKGSLPVPLHLRNAPTSLMKAFGYGKGYKYAHDFRDALTGQKNFPEQLEGTEYYRPTETGREKRIKEYLDWYKKQRQQLRQQAGADEG
ncbi:MAG: replication-associated recombination protein A [Candidatus Zixiibacteriota bacterium]|nr:MAG: replication-associated recombination protein A [candidate division Zixibacteria bacterium]